MDLNRFVELCILPLNGGVIVLCFLLYRVTRVPGFLIIMASHLCSFSIRVASLIEHYTLGTQWVVHHAGSMNLPTHGLALLGYWMIYSGLRRAYSGIFIDKPSDPNGELIDKL